MEDGKKKSSYIVHEIGVLNVLRIAEMTVIIRMFFEGLVVSAALLWPNLEMTVKVKGIIPSNFSRRFSMTVKMRTLVCVVSSGHVSYLWTSMVSSSRKDTQAQRKKTWLQKIIIPIKKPAPRMMVSAGWAYSACMPNGAWKKKGHIVERSVCASESV